MAATFDLGEHIARLFRMTDDVWARHANGWSVWTRIASFPFMVLALWSHVWIGWLGAAVAVAAVSVWIWLNPRIFAIPLHTDTWAAKVTFGERVWLNRNTIPIPDHHARMAQILSVVSGVGFITAVAGAIVTWVWPTIVGVILVYAGKLWFCDRMVWLYEDMKDRDPDYRSWLR